MPAQDAEWLTPTSTPMRPCGRSHLGMGDRAGAEQRGHHRRGEAKLEHGVEKPPPVEPAGPHVADRLKKRRLVDGSGPSRSVRRVNPGSHAHLAQDPVGSPQVPLGLCPLSHPAGQQAQT